MWFPTLHFDKHIFQIMHMSKNTQVIKYKLSKAYDMFS